MPSVKRIIWIGLIILVGILVGSRWIVTDSKRVHRVLQNCEKSVRDGDADGLMSQIASDYDYQGMDWAKLRQMSRTVFKRNQFSTTWLGNIRIELDGNAATVHFTAVAEPAAGSVLPGSITGWRLKLLKRGRIWRITEIEMLMLNGNGVGTLKQMMEQAAALGGD